MHKRLILKLFLIIFFSLGLITLSRLPKGLNFPSFSYHEFNETDIIDLFVLEDLHDWEQMHNYPSPNNEIELTDEQKQFILSYLPEIKAKKLSPLDWKPTGLNIRYPEIAYVKIEKDLFYIEMALVKTDTNNYQLYIIDHAPVYSQWYLATNADEVIVFLSSFDPFYNNPVPNISHYAGNSAIPRPFQ